MAGGLSLHRGLLLWHLSLAALLLHAGGAGHLSHLPHLRLHNTLLVHAAPAGRAHVEGRVLAAVGSHPALPGLQHGGLWVLSVGTCQ